MMVLLVDLLSRKLLMSREESLALDTSGTWAPNTLRNPLITQQLEFWRRGESEYSGLLKTRNLLISRDAKNAENGKIAPNWNVSGTRRISKAARISRLFFCTRRAAVTTCRSPALSQIFSLIRNTNGLFPLDRFASTKRRRTGTSSKEVWNREYYRAIFSRRSCVNGNFRLGSNSLIAVRAHLFIRCFHRSRWTAKRRQKTVEPVREGRSYLLQHLSLRIEIRKDESEGTLISQWGVSASS
jgi:hypothetical protein